MFVVKKKKKEEFLTYLASTLRQRVLKFRLSNHRQSLGVLRDKRVCNFSIYDSGEVGDEFH